MIKFCRGHAAIIAFLVLVAVAVGPAGSDLIETLNPVAASFNPTIKTHDSGPEALEIIKGRGFIGEMYNVLTPDGVYLSMYHIINPLANQQTLNKYPVLIAHGVIGDAAQMLGHSERSRPRRPKVGDITVDSSDTCLAFFMSNNNWDVWMFDARGTNLNNHKVSENILTPEGQKFWDFSLDEQIQIDLPTAIDFVLAQTHEEKLHYIAFSESTSFMFALLSWAPHYADKLVNFVALAPVCYIENISGVTLTLFGSAALVPDNINGNFVNQLYTDAVASPLRMLCQNELVTKTLCISVTSALGGIGPNELSHGFYATTFKGTSIKSVKHFLQMYAQRRYGMYDHGTAKNMLKYGQPTPPRYDIGRIRLPFIILFRGDRDLLSDPKDQQRLLREMGTKPYLDFHFSNYNHLDFIMSKTIVNDVNLPAVKAMFGLLKLHTAHLGTILRDPIKLTLPTPYKPVKVSLPDGNRRVGIRNDLVHNAVTGVAEAIEARLRPVAQTGLIPAGMVQPSLNLLRSVGSQMDVLGSGLSKVNELAGIGSIEAP